jgi:uncharacterized protein
MPGFRIDVADLLAHPGTRRDIDVSEVVDGLTGSAAAVPGAIDVAVRLERISEGIVVRGTVSTRWVGQCSYCLADLAETLSLHVDELFEPTPVEGETYPIVGYELDLEQLVRDAVLLELPLAPHCAEPCLPDAELVQELGDDDESRGLNPDPRWAALSELEIR